MHWFPPRCLVIRDQGLHTASQPRLYTLSALIDLPIFLLSTARASLVVAIFSACFYKRVPAAASPSALDQNPALYLHGVQNRNDMQNTTVSMTKHPLRLHEPRFWVGERSRSVVACSGAIHSPRLQTGNPCCYTRSSPELGKRDTGTWHAGALGCCS